MRYTSDIKDIKEFRLVKSVAYNFVLSVFITILLAVISIYAFNLRLDIVLSDSMSPVFYEDDIVVLKPCDEYEVNDIIEYQISAISKPITHRVKEKHGTGKNAVYITQGDASGQSDAPVTHSQVNGKVIGIIEDGNHTYEFIKTNYFLFIDILLGIWVLSSTVSSESEMRKHNIAKEQ